MEWHIRRALAPILFNDEERDAAEGLRESVVSPANRSPKAQRKHTENGEPVHSFQTLLEDLATINRNRVHLKSPSIADPAALGFVQITTPTPLQQRALDLLGLPLAL